LFKAIRALDKSDIYLGRWSWAQLNSNWFGQRWRHTKCGI